VGFKGLTYSSRPDQLVHWIHCWKLYGHRLACLRKLLDGWFSELQYWGSELRYSASAVWVWTVYRVSQKERSIFWEVTVSVILRKKVYMNMCPIPKGFQYLASSIFLPSHRNAPLSEACESVWSVIWLLWLLLVVVDWSRYFRRSYYGTKLPRISAKLITRRTRWCSFGYTDCYILSAWRSPSLLYQTRDATYQCHFP
jgi:hypothetical protein